MEPNSIMMMFEFIIGVYLLYAAITGKGAAYKDENIKKDKKEEFHKIMRLFCAIFGPVALAQGAFDYLGTQTPKLPIYATLSTVALGVFGAGIIALFVYVYRITDRPAKK